MPIIKSAKKALRQSYRRRERNLVWKEKLKKAVKAASTSKTPEALSQAYKIIDKSAKAGIVPKNKASRMKSKLARPLTTK